MKFACSVDGVVEQLRPVYLTLSRTEAKEILFSNNYYFSKLISRFTELKLGMFVRICCCSRGEFNHSNGMQQLMPVAYFWSWTLAF